MLVDLGDGIRAFVCKRDHSGFIVITKSGKEGYTKHSDKLINGKTPVYFENSDLKMLCSPDKLEIIGYRD